MLERIEKYYIKNGDIEGARNASSELERRGGVDIAFSELGLQEIQKAPSPWTENAQGKREYRHSQFVFVQNDGSIEVRGKKDRLTFRENQLLSALIDAGSQTTSGNELLKKVWGENYEQRVVIMYIFRLRRKIEINFREPKIIVNARRYGYFLRD